MSTPLTSELPPEGPQPVHGWPEGTTPAPEEPNSLWRWLPDTLWGYDFFVSYHWDSGGAYAVSLAQRLRDRHYDVFLDRVEYAAGDDWREVGRRALRHTQRLVVVATREAIARSQPVAREVTIFTSRGKRVIPIVFGTRFTAGERARFPLLALMPDSVLDIVEHAERRPIGPSDLTVDRLINTYKMLRRRSLRAIVVGVALSLLTLACLVTYGQYRIAEQRRIDSESRRLATLANNLGPTRPDLGAILSVQAYRVAPTKDAAASVLSAILHEPRLTRFLIGQSGHVEHLAFSANGQVLASGNDAGIVVLWDVATGQVVQTLKHPSGAVERLAVSLDSDFVAVGYADGTLLLRDTQNKKSQEWRPFKDTATFDDINFSEDGAYLLAQSASDVWRLDISTRQYVIHHLGDADGPTDHAVFRADGKTVLAGGSDGVVFSFDLKTGQRTELARLDVPISALAYDAGSGRYAVGTEEGRIVVYRAGAGDPIEFRRAGAERGPTERSVYRIRFGAGGTLLAASFGDLGKELVTWPVARDAAPVAQDHPGLLHDFAFDASGAHLASAGLYSRLLIHDPRTGERLGEPLGGHGQQVYRVAFAPGAGSIMVSSGDEGSVILWDLLRTSRIAQSATPGTNLPSSVEGVAFSPADGTIAGGGGDALLFIQPPGYKRAVVRSKAGDMQIFRRLAFSRDGNLLAAGGELDGLVLHRRRQDWTSTFVALDSQVEAIFVTPDAKTIRVVDGDGVIRTIRAADGKEMSTVPTGFPEDRDRGAIFAAAFRRDGAEAALGCQGGDLFVVSSRDGNIVHHSKRRGIVTALAYSPDGTMLASCAENSIRLTEPRTDRVIETLLDRHPSAVDAVAFSSDGTMLAAGCVDGTILLFDVPTRQPIGSIPAHTDAVFALAFHPTAKVLLSGSKDQRALLFNLEYTFARGEAVRIAGRNLSRDEWNRYVGANVPYERTFAEFPAGADLSAQ